MAWACARGWGVAVEALVDLAHHLVLTGGELLDGFLHVGKLPLDSLLHRGDMRLYPL